jgi:DNA-binding IclR family transcriptional regulator
MTSYAGNLDLWAATVLPLLANGPKPCVQLGYSISTAQRALEGLRKAGLVRPKMHRAGKILVEHWYRTEDLLQRASAAGSSQKTTGARTKTGLRENRS